MFPSSRIQKEAVKVYCARESYLALPRCCLVAPKSLLPSFIEGKILEITRHIWSSPCSDCSTDSESCCVYRAHNMERTVNKKQKCHSPELVTNRESVASVVVHPSGWIEAYLYSGEHD